MNKYIYFASLFVLLFIFAPIVKADSLSNSCISLSTNLTIGNSGESVYKLQKFLVVSGYLEGDYPTGYFDEATKQAVILFQTAKGINPNTGLVGPLTRANLSISSGCEDNEQKNINSYTPSKSDNKTIIIKEPKPKIVKNTNTSIKIKGKNLSKDLNVEFFLNGEYINAITDLLNIKNKILNFKIPSTVWNTLKNNYYEIRVVDSDEVSNFVSIKVDKSSDKNSFDPFIKMVRGKAGEDFEVYPGESIGIEGKNLIYAGKDARVFINGIEAYVTQYDNRVIFFTTPQLKDGKYDLYIENSYGRSNFVTVKVVNFSYNPIIYNINSKAGENFTIYEGELIFISGGNLVYAGKDTKISVCGQNVNIRQYDNKVISFTAPDFDLSETGNVCDLVLSTSFGSTKTKVIIEKY